MIGLMDYLAECKLHEKKFTLMQIGDKGSQRVQMSSCLSHANPPIGFMQKEILFASCICMKLPLKLSGNGKHVDFLA
jgi:hypothetical protein